MATNFGDESGRNISNVLRNIALDLARGNWQRVQFTAQPDENSAKDPDADFKTKTNALRPGESVGAFKVGLEDHKLAEPICKVLREFGLSTWIDQDQDLVIRANDLQEAQIAVSKAISRYHGEELKEAGSVDMQQEMRDAVAAYQEMQGSAQRDRTIQGPQI